MTLTHLEHPNCGSTLARSYLNLGTIIPANDRFDDAKRAYDRSIVILGGLAKELPDKPDYLHELSVAHNNMGNLLLRTERASDAQASLRAGRKGFELLARDFPKVPVYHQELANSFNSTGSACSRRKISPVPSKPGRRQRHSSKVWSLIIPILALIEATWEWCSAILESRTTRRSSFAGSAQLEKAADHLKRG